MNTPGRCICIQKGYFSGEFIPMQRFPVRTYDVPSIKIKVNCFRFPVDCSVVEQGNHTSICKLHEQIWPCHHYRQVSVFVARLKDTGFVFVESDSIRKYKIYVGVRGCNFHCLGDVGMVKEEVVPVEHEYPI